MALMPVAEVIARILDGVQPLEAENVPVTEAGARVLAETLCAKLTQPPFDASAMDGYAVRAADLASLPATLRIVGAAAAGAAFSGQIDTGEAVRIFTGAPVPKGADTIVIQENTKKSMPDRVEILEANDPGRHIRSRGYDFSEGMPLIEAGRKLTSRHLLLAASMNHAALPVTRKPVIAILPTGDELVAPGSIPGPDQIISSVPAGLKAAVESWGADARILDIARDNRDHLAACVSQGAGADVLVTIGGASVGEHDLVQGVLEHLGARFQVLKVAMRPGKPLMFGMLGEQRVISLPGNPVSALICARVFLKPLIDKMLGLRTSDKLSERRLAAALPRNGDREHYMRAELLGDAVMPLSDQDSSLMAIFVKSECLIVRPVAAPACEKGSQVPLLLLDF